MPSANMFRRGTTLPSPLPANIINHVVARSFSCLSVLSKLHSWMRPSDSYLSHIFVAVSVVCCESKMPSCCLLPSTTSKNDKGCLFHLPPNECCMRKLRVQISRNRTGSRRNHLGSVESFFYVFIVCIFLWSVFQWVTDTSCSSRIVSFGRCRKFVRVC